MGIKAVNDRSAVIAAIKECDAKGREQFLSDHHFGKARSYFLVYKGKRYDSKAILAVAHKNQFGVVMTNGDFSGGDRAVKATLESMAFSVVVEKGSSAPAAKAKAKAKVDWSEAELAGCVSTYLAFMKDANAGKAMNKAAAYRMLAARFGRTAKSIEYRMQNISYVLSLMGRRWVPGLAPAMNVGPRNAARIESLVLKLQGQKNPTVAEEIIRTIAARKRVGNAPPKGCEKPASKSVAVTQYDRDRTVKAWVLNKANGRCECCGKPAPFKTVDGPFLEVHHVLRLAEGGSDTTCNAAALCPNCHRRLHFSIDAPAIIASLYKRISRLRVPGATAAPLFSE